MKIVSFARSNLVRDIILGVLLIVSLAALQANAQQVVGGDTQVSGGATGVIQALAQDDGRVTISGRVYGFDHEITQVFLGDAQVSAATLDEGMSVRFTVNNRGIITQMRILGPFNELRLLDQN